MRPRPGDVSNAATLAKVTRRKLTDTSTVVRSSRAKDLPQSIMHGTVLPRTKKAPSKQLKDVINFFAKADMTAKFEQLPPADDLTFEDYRDPHVAEGRNSRKMFLGGNSRRHVWAYLKLNDRRAHEVVIMICPAPSVSNATGWSRIIVADMDMNGVELMYPFRILCEKCADVQYARRGLNVLIQCYFLERGEVDVVWASTRTILPRLKTAINTITKAYADYPGGVEAVPDTYGPDNIPSEEAKLQETSNGPHRQVPQQVYFRPRSNTPVEGKNPTMTMSPVPERQAHVTPIPDKPRSTPRGKEKRPAEDDFTLLLSLRERLKSDLKMEKEAEAEFKALEAKHKQFMWGMKRRRMETTDRIQMIVGTKTPEDLTQFFLGPALGDEDKENEE